MAELDARVEELERLKDQMQDVGMSIVKAVSDGDLTYQPQHRPFSIRKCVLVT
jgi:adenylate cyclase class IV